MKREAVIATCLLMLMAFPFALSPAGSNGQLTQCEWAIDLSRALGLKGGLPEDAGSDRIISILSQRGFREIEGEDYREADDALRKVDAPSDVAASQQQWVEAGSEGGVARYYFEIPLQQEIILRARGQGAPQFWSIDTSQSILLDIGDELEWMEVGRFNLDPGEHKVEVSIPSGGVLDIFEIIAPGHSPIEPLGGFRPSDPLTYEDKAVTMVRALNLENELPIDDGFFLIRESELYDQVDGEYQVSSGEESGKPSQGRWVKPSSGSRIYFKFEVPEAGIYSIFSRGFGQFEEEWVLDRGSERVIFQPEDQDEFGWNPVFTVFLEAGPHTLEIRPEGDNGFDVFQILRHRSRGVDYLQLLSDLGFREGTLPPSQGEVGSEGRRYASYREVEAEDYFEADGEPTKERNEEYGEPSNRVWINPGGEPVPLRYRLQVEREGTYAIYMRGFGSSPVTWAIDPSGESYRELRDVFPRAADAFVWQEVVTLDLEAGEHIFEVTLPPDSGLDLFELRRQPWTFSDLDLLARREVDREQGQRNIEELEKRIAELGRGVEPPAGVRLAAPSEEPEYPILSPYVPWD